MFIWCPFPETAVIISPLAENTGHDRGKTHLAACGQVGSLGNQASGNAQSDQKTNRGIADQIRQVGPGEEIVLQASHHNGCDNQQKNNGIAGDSFPHSLWNALLFLLILHGYPSD